jgi:molybdenum cofactor cytidylyltransferase
MSGNWELKKSFDIKETPELVAFVGAGGKTTLMMALAQRLSGRVIITTTTHLFAAQIESAAVDLPAVTWRYQETRVLDKDELLMRRYLLVGKPKGDRVTGVPLEAPGKLLARSDVDYVLVEADGAKMHPIKAPAEHEPALPQDATLVLPVIGIDGLGGRIIDVAHRPKHVAHLLGKKDTDTLSVEDLAFLLSQQNTGLKGVPETTRVIAVINKVDTSAQLVAARQVACLVLQQSRVQQVVISNALSARVVLEVHKRVTAVVLAAGQSQRMGRSKQLLEWGDTTMLGQTVRNLKDTAVHDILVVTGSENESVEAIARAEDVRTVYNRRYASGEMLSSLQTAIKTIPPNRAAVLVMMADQPMVTARDIDLLLQAYWRGEGDIIAPEFGGQRGNPVLIDRHHFEELLALPLGAAPRDLLRRHKVTLIPASKAVLQDIDEPEAYERYRPGARQVDHGRESQII